MVVGNDRRHPESGIQIGSIVYAFYSFEKNLAVVINKLHIRLPVHLTLNFWYQFEAKV